MDGLRGERDSKRSFFFCLRRFVPKFLGIFDNFLPQKSPQDGSSAEFGGANYLFGPALPRAENQSPGLPHCTRGWVPPGELDPQEWGVVGVVQHWTCPPPVPPGPKVDGVSPATAAVLRHVARVEAAVDRAIARGVVHARERLRRPVLERRWLRVRCSHSMGAPTVCGPIEQIGKYVGFALRS